MKIYLKWLTLVNFKGIRSFSTEFDQETNILGDNATGKTSLKDAFLWLFFGKDSSDRTDFEIKTLDENNVAYHKLDHEVSAGIEVDGETIVIKRVYRENWVKKHGDTEQKFKGHVQEFFWNDVPMKESEFKAKVADVFNEGIFKLITNTEYFNSMKWQERRAVLLSIAGNISNDDIIRSLTGTTGQFDELIKAFQQKKSVEDFKKEIAAKKKKIKDELDLLPSRISEAKRALPEEKDYSDIERQLNAALANLESVESLLMNKSKAEREYQESLLQKTQEVGNLKQQAQQIEFTEKNAVKAKANNRLVTIQDKKQELRILLADKDRLLVHYNAETKRKDGLELLKKEMAEKWEAINKETLVINDNELKCPTCKREYEADNIDAKKESFAKNFNSDKTRRLEEVKARGEKMKDEIKVIDADLANTIEKGSALKSKIELLQNDISILEEEHSRLSANEELEYKTALQSNSEYAGINEMIRLRNEEIENRQPVTDNSDLLTRKRSIQSEIDQFKTELSSKGQREKQLARVTELEDQENTMANELSQLEGTEFSILQFEKAKMDELENRINNRFKIVKFKLFETQINEGEKPACITLINGVPYADANTAAKIQAGLDIINTLSDHYDTYGPVWVDNRESVIKLPGTKSQLINLVVSEQHKKLTVVRKNAMVEA